MWQQDMSDYLLLAKELNEILNHFEHFVDVEFKNDSNKIYSIIDELKSLETEVIFDTSDSDRKAFLESLTSSQFDFFSNVINQKKALRLLLDAQSIYIKMLQKELENIAVLNEIIEVATEKEHELNVQIVSHEKLLKKEKDDISKRARFAANKRHERKNYAKNEIKKIWATGKYTNKDLCAEQECEALGLSFSTARKALRNQ